MIYREVGFKTAGYTYFNCNVKLPNETMGLLVLYTIRPMLWLN
jgi:hypothetical protein